MKRILISIIVLLSSFYVTQISALAGALDELKNAIVDVQKTNDQGFLFANFKVVPGAAGSNTWSVEMTVNKPVSVNTYVVKTLFKNRNGEVISSGDDISLPAGNAGKTYNLTRSFIKDSKISSVTLNIHNLTDNKIAASQTYPLSAVSSYDIQGASTSDKPGISQNISGGGISKDTNLDYSIAYDAAMADRFTIKNKSSFALKISEISGKAKFLAGIDQDVEASCYSKDIQPGKDVSCRFDDSVLECPALTSVDIEFRLNGNVFHEAFGFDAPIKEITNPVVRLSKSKYDNVIGNGSGTAEVMIRGAFIRKGSKVTIKALASVDSDRFPVVFDATQDEEMIHGTVEVVGTSYNKTPDQFCFNISEISTCDDLNCGGTGLLLYRNNFQPETHIITNGSYFLNQKQCE